METDLALSLGALEGRRRHWQAPPTDLQLKPFYLKRIGLHPKLYVTVTIRFAFDIWLKGENRGKKKEKRKRQSPSANASGCK